MELLEEWKKQEAALTELGLSEDELSAHAVTFAIGAHAGMALVQR